MGGTLPLRTTDPQRVRNTTLVFAPDGRCVARYDKIHLFWFDNGREQFHEGRVIEARATTLRCGLTCPRATATAGAWACRCATTCAFPELFRAHARAGADVLLVPSAFTHVTGPGALGSAAARPRHREPGLRWWHPPRAVHENGRHTWGQSPGGRPWGQVLAQQAQGPGVVLADLDPERLRGVRQQLPALTTAFYEHHFARHLAPLAQRHGGAGRCGP